MAVSPARVPGDPYRTKPDHAKCLIPGL